MKVFENLMSDLRKKIYQPVYFMEGDEPYFMDKATRYISESVLPDEEKTFNQIILYGRETDIATVINAAKKYPMTSNLQVVIVKEAQHLARIEDLRYYLENPLNSTILVINYKYNSLDKRKKLFKLLHSKNYHFEFKKIYENKVPDWISHYLMEKKGCRIDLKASMLLIEFLGNDLGKIANELDKLIIALPGEKNHINAGDIETNIGVSKDYNNFELQDAIAKKDVLKTYRITNHFSGNQKNNPISLTISALYAFFRKVLMYHIIRDKPPRIIASSLKIHPFFIKEYRLAAGNYSKEKIIRIFSMLREYDLKSKGYGNLSTPPGELLKELVYKIIH